MDDPSFIIASWVLTFGVIGLYARWTLRSARRHGSGATDEELPWR